MTERPDAQGAPDAAGDANETPAQPLRSAFLDGLVGYNVRRSWLRISELFSERMLPFGLKQVDFSVLSLLAENPGASSRQVSATLSVQPPNLVKIIGGLDARGLIRRKVDASDRRSLGLYLTPAGKRLYAEAQSVVSELEADSCRQLTAHECSTLLDLLKRV